MENLPTTRKLHAILPPRAPIPHAGVVIDDKDDISVWQK
jgi:hypothetical protein